MLRVVLLVNTVMLNVYRRDNFDHPGAGLALVAALVAWTAFATWGYAASSRRGPALLVADLAVAVAALGLTPVVKGAEFNASVPGFWVMAALLAWAVRFRLPGGLVAGVVLAGTDLVLREDVGQTEYGYAFLLVIGGPIVGYMCGSLQQMASERDQAQRTAAAARERARLARAVHDGVLQVLALVQRRGSELGGDGAELGRLAGEQEAALRTLIRTQDAAVTEPVTVTVDLADVLGRLGTRPGVEVALPGGLVEVPSQVGAELEAAVDACLDNVRVHAGDHARAWVLLEGCDDRVQVVVRDDGPGIPEGRLAQAAAEGRLGVAESIEGRLRDLGGTATVASGSFGTEWTLVAPRPGEIQRLR